jgi:integrase
MRNIYLRKALSDAMQTKDYSNIIVSYYKDGEIYKPLSRFPDSTWRLPDHWFTKATASARKVMNFNSVNDKFVLIFKIAILNFLIEFEESTIRRSGHTITSFYWNSLPFFEFIAPSADRLQNTSSFLMINYANQLKEKPGRKTENLGADAQYAYLRAVETLHKLTVNTHDPLPQPWPDTSADYLSGRNQIDASGVVRTLRIPDKILSSLFQAAVATMREVNPAIAIRNDLEGLSKMLPRRQYMRARDESAALHQIDLTELALASRLHEALIACAIVVLTTTGIRADELLTLERGCCIFKKIDGALLPCITGLCNGLPNIWVATVITHEALAVAEKLTAPLSKILAHVETDKFFHSRSATIPKQLSFDHQSSIFLTSPSEGKPTTMTSKGLTTRLKKFIKKLGLPWNLTSHQFRPTFAHYVAHSLYGDLRYLREHYSHWSLDMTVEYAGQSDSDGELLEDIYISLSDIKHKVVAHFFDEETPISGGLADSVRAFRQELKVYNDQKQMVRSVADSVNIRATTVGWCTNDRGNCIGGHGPEKTRCASGNGCESFITDDTKILVWQGILSQQMELLNIKDLGQAGIDRANRDMRRAKQVLEDLGFKSDDLDNTEHDSKA